MAISDDNIDWDQHWIEHKDDEDFTDPSVFNSFIGFLEEGF